jgi:hypothetical protein
MRLTGQASLLVAFSLLTSAATAHAECAWVLWALAPSRGAQRGMNVLTAYPAMRG